jgi:hypothetical protein
MAFEHHNYENNVKRCSQLQQTKFQIRIRLLNLLNYTVMVRFLSL